MFSDDHMVGVLETEAAMPASLHIQPVMREQVFVIEWLSPRSAGKPQAPRIARKHCDEKWDCLLGVIMGTLC